MSVRTDLMKEMNIPPHKELRKLFNHIRWILTQK